MQEEGPSKEQEESVAKDTEQSAIYSGIRNTILNQIKNNDLDGSFGTKIDTLARHMLWIREHDPGAKSIVFSQYRDFLDVLARGKILLRLIAPRPGVILSRKVCERNKGGGYEALLLRTVSYKST